MSTRHERGIGQMLIQQVVVQQASAAALWHKLISPFSAVVDPEALPLRLESISFKSDKATKD